MLLEVCYFIKRRKTISNYRYLDFSDIIPEDDFLYNEIINKSLADNHSLIINWGRSFPWAIDERLSLVSHFDEKTVNSINNRLERNFGRIIPLIPLFGGMEFLLSFPSYLYMRIEKDNCSVLNPKTAGSVSIIESIVEDYKSIFTNTEYAAIDMRYLDLCLDKVSEDEIIRFFSKLSAVLEDLISGFIIVYSGENQERADKIFKKSGFKNYIIAYIESRKDFSCNCNYGNEKLEIRDTGPEFYLSENEVDKYRFYLSSIDKIWKNIIYMKDELLKYQIFEYSVRVKNFELILLFAETEKLFQDIVIKGGKLATGLKGKIKNDSICRMFRSRQKVIETELVFLKSGLDNYFIELDNCL